MERRSDERRRCGTFMGQRGMRCEACGSVWFSAIAGLVADRFRCVACEGSLHVERRTGIDRRTGEPTSPA